MNKNAIQKFAIWARNELIAQVSQRAYQYGIDESGFGDASADTLNGRLLTAEEKSQRQELIKQIKEKGYKQVMEEVAYTWFNRFIALRFMEVNNYLPSHIRVFSDASGAFKPEILNDVLHLDLPGLDSGKVAEYIESNDTEALYRYLLLTQCNALNGALPVMFERMGGYTEMLLPNNILRQDSVLGHMVSDIPEEDWQDAVQIIGWLYQYYNTELKDDTFAQLKKNVKIKKERTPAATQLFTPDWIVRYMVESYAQEQREQGNTALADTLLDICDTPVSPELLPPTSEGVIAQKTEETIGSYDLHDFFLYHLLRNHFAPRKIYALAKIAFSDRDPSLILSTLKTFYRRFFTQQFKRNCMPDGVKVGSVCLSPRGDWRMPSDASFALWMNELEEL